MLSLKYKNKLLSIFYNMIRLLKQQQQQQKLPYACTTYLILIPNETIFNEKELKIKLS